MRAAQPERALSVGAGTVVPKVTAELFVIPLELGRHLIYAPLRHAAFVANTRIVNFIADLQVGTFDASADPDGALIGLLCHLGIVDGGPVTPPVTTFSGTPAPTTVTLFLTTACNLRCTYCYASAGDTPKKAMPLAVATRGVDFVAANAVKRSMGGFEVLYHGGGEPTANWAVMTGSLDYARQRAAALRLEVRAATATNGVLNDEQIEWIVRNLNGASVSFDGLPAMHDLHRPTAAGRASSHRVMHTLQRFDEAGFAYGVRVTVTDDQILHLPDSVEFICTHFGVKQIQVEPVYQLGRWSGRPSAETEGFVAAYRAAQERAARHGRQIHYSAARLGILTNHFCGISQDSFALTPDGNVSACYEAFSEDNPWASIFFYGAPDAENGGYAFDLARLNHLRRQAVEQREYCRGCFAKWTCGGDCYHKSLTVTGEREFAGSDRCHITRELTKDQILAKIAASGGLVWKETDAETPREHEGGAR